MSFSRGTRVAVVAALVAGGTAALPAATGQAADIPATLVKQTWTGGPNSNWDPPSPDPSGITYNPRTGTLLISDGEVEETQFSCNVYRGTNLYGATLQGALVESGGNTTAYTLEPVGIGLRPATAEQPERIFISDDDKDRIHEVDRGADGKYGTGDDGETSFSIRFTNSNQDDGEDVSVVQGSTEGELLIIGGISKKVHIYSWGPNRTYDALASTGTGDDTVRSFDVGVYGATDPEGVTYNPFRNTMFVLDDPSNKIYEIDMQGGLQNVVTLPFTMKKGAGITLAPPSSGAVAPDNAYIVDRGADNDPCPPTFNDGRLYEITLPGLTQTRSATGTPPPPPPPPVLRYSHAFNADAAPDVIAAKSDGALLFYPGNGKGNFLSGPTQIGAGWNSRDMIRHGQDFDRDGKRDVIARNPSNGDLWLYRGNGSGGFAGQAVAGTGWNSFTAIVAPGDWNGDGNPDVITVRSNGDMNLYPGNGAGGFGTSYPQIGSGFGSRDQIISAGDWDGDGRNDLIARNPSNGDLWLYSGNGTGGFKGQRVIGGGWNIFDAIVGPGDWSGDGFNDLIARRKDGNLYLYPGNGRGGFGSSYPKFNSGWSGLRLASSGTK